MTDDQNVPDQDTDNPTEEIATTKPSGIPVTSEGDMVIGGFAFTPTALVPADGDNPPSFEDWEAVGNYLRYIHTGTQFWLGDWINYGESRYGEKYAQAVEHTGYELSTLQTYAWVSRSVPPSNRLETVPFGHYANGIASLPPDEQAQWAKRVADEGMTQKALKNALAENRAAKGEKPVDLWLVVLCKSQADFDRLEKKMRDEGREVTSRVTVHREPKKPKADKAKKKGGAVTQKPVGTPKKKKAAKNTTTALVTDTKGNAKIEQVDDTVSDQPGGEVDKGWLKDQFYIAPPPNETPAERAKRRKKINNARFRAQQKK